MPHNKIAYFIPFVKFIVSYKIGLMGYKRRIWCKNNDTIPNLVCARLYWLIIFHIRISRHPVNRQQALPAAIDRVARNILYNGVI